MTTYPDIKAILDVPSKTRLPHRLKFPRYNNVSHCACIQKEIAQMTRNVEGIELFLLLW